MSDLDLCRVQRIVTLTYNLKRRHVTLPRQVFLVLWTQGCHEVVEVHHHMDVSVHKRAPNTRVTQTELHN